MSSLITNTISIFFWISCITVIRSQVQPTESKFQNEANEIDDDSLGSIDAQLSAIDPLIWIVIALICIICSLCTVFICYCALQNKFNKEMAEVHRLSQLTLEQHIRSFSTTDKSDINIQTLHPPSKSHSHSPRSHPEPPSIHQMMPHQLLPRSKSAPRDTLITVRPDKISPNARHKATNSAGNGYHQYVNAVRMWTNPVYHTNKESGTHTAHAMSLTIPSIASDHTLPTMTYMSSNSSRQQRTSPVPNVAINNTYNKPQRQYKPRISRSVPSQMSHDQEVPTPIPGTPPAAMHNMMIQQHQPMMYTPHKSSLKSIRSTVPNEYKALPKQSSNPKERLNLNLEYALNALSPPHFEDGSSDVAWTEASMTGNQTVQDMASVGSDGTGIVQYMFGGNKRNDDDMDEEDEDGVSDDRTQSY